MRRTALAGSLLAAALTAPLGAQTTATFSAYASPTTTEYQATPGAPVSSGDLDFYEFFSGNARNVLATWGTDAALDPFGASNLPSNLGGSTAMWDTAISEIDLYGHGSDPNDPAVTFNLYSIDVAHLYSTANIPVVQNFNLTFSGFGLTGPVISQTFTITAPPVVGGVQTPLLQTLVFDARWRSLLNVWWNQSNFLSQAHQFTNVVAQVTPEPSSYLLVVSGLLALAVVAARRRRA